MSGSERSDRQPAIGVKPGQTAPSSSGANHFQPTGEALSGPGWVHHQRTDDHYLLRPFVGAHTPVDRPGCYRLGTRNQTRPGPALEAPGAQPATHR